MGEQATPISNAQRLRRVVLAIGVLSVCVALPPATAASAIARAPSGAIHATAPTMAPAAAPGAALSGSPGVPIADPATHTLYVPIQCVHDFCSDGKPSHDIDLINTARCTAASHCHVVTKARAGKSPFAAALDDKAHTLYVANAGGTDPGAKGNGSVSVFNTNRCNVAATSGCRQPVATIHTGGFLVAAALDPATHTLYLADLQGSVIVLDVRKCNATKQVGCQRRIHSVTDKAGPSGIAIDEAHATVYASDVGVNGDGNTVSLINAATCNSRHISGCSKKPHKVTVGSAPYWDTVDQKTDTVYTANGNESTVSLINARSCNATVRTGCRKTAKTVEVGNSPQFVDVDQKLHSVLALTANDDTVATLDTKTCHAGSFSKCPATARSAQAAPNQGRNYVSFPSAFALVPKTSMLYATGVGGRSALAVVSVSRCNATTSKGCRHEPPSIARPEGELTVDASTHTLYAANLNHHRIDLFSTSGCNASTRSHCTPVGSIPVADPGQALSGVNETTHTLYAADFNGDVSVIGVASCNAATTTGCGSAVKATVHVGENASDLAENPATHSLYVIYGPFDATPNFVGVLDVSACKAANTSGCSQTPAAVPVGPGANTLAVSPAANSVYVSNSGSEQFGFGHTVSIIDGATCKGTVHTGCAHPAAKARVGLEPAGIVIDDAKHSVYVVANANGDAPGNVTVLNSNTCNGATTTGCGGSHPAAGIGRSGLLAALDPQAHKVYVSDFSSAGVSVVNGATCNAGTTSGCVREVPLRAVASQPFGIAVDGTEHTVYVATFADGGTLSLVPTG